MEVPFTSEQLAELTRIARDEGTTPAQLVQEAGLRLIEDDARFREAMRQGMNDSGGLFAARPEADAAWLPELPDQPIMEAPQKLCPLCGHRFKGNGWDGIDAHWRARHEATMPYERAWPLIRSGRYEFRALR
jgi:hypothetical protein